MKRIETEVEDEERILWKAYCKSQNITGAYALREFIRQSINHNSKPIEVKTETDKCQIYVRLTAAEVNEIYKKAAEEGYPNKTAWSKSVIKKAIGCQVYSDNEVATIRETNLELIAIGRNLNQIAHALNIESRDGDKKVKLDFLQELDEKINRQVKQIYAFLDKSSEEI